MSAADLHGTLAIVGAGQAAAQVAEAAREHGWRGPIVLIGEESVPPYQRPPLSKQYLAGLHDAHWLHYRPGNFYTRHAVRLLLGRRALAIDRAQRQVTLDDGSTAGWDRLVLATGCRVRALPVPGADGRVRYLRTVADVDRIRADLAHARRVLIVGGGFIGLESAAVLVQQGLEVTVLEAGDRVLARSVPAPVSDFLAAEHARRGVRLETGVAVAALADDGNGGTEVIATGGRCWAADVVIAGVGVLPNTELAAAAGLPCQDGILVDEFARTADPAILAVGDCTRHPNAVLGRSVRLETVHNAVEQARTAGAMLCGVERPYRQVPWVWSDQYDLRLQSVGEGADRLVVRGTPESRSFAVFTYAGERLRGVHCVNRPTEFAAVRRLLDAGIALDRAQAAADVDLRTLLPARPPAAFEQPWPPAPQRHRAAS